MDDGGGLGDAFEMFCTAPTGSANINRTDTTMTIFRRLDAGGIWQTGPFTAVQPPMTVDLLFVNDDPLDANTASCCIHSDPACCGHDGIVAHSVGALAFGAEVGSHTFTFTDTKQSFSLDGTITINAFVQPFLSKPGRIAGSVSLVAGSRAISGTFDHAFCPILLNQTI
jgi:hypothetical protein